MGPMTTVFLSAAAEARPWCLSALVEGFETELADEDLSAGEVELVAALPARGFPGPGRSHSSLPEVPRLVGRPTGREYRGLPWWEAVLA